MEYYSLNNYLKDKYNRKIYKIAINAGLTCPNRDGKLDTRGCIFCSKGGSGDFAANKNLSITEQIESAIHRIEAKMPAATKDIKPSYIAYFQAFTNTYGDISYLKDIYYEALNHPKVIGLSIATRPDCLNDDILSLLNNINQIKPVWVELGLQTIHEDTARYIRRGYDLEIYDQAVKKLNKINLPQVVTHIIIGLPGENKDMIIETVRHSIQAGTTGIKLALLHVLKNTDLAIDYEAGIFNVLSMDEYIDILISCLKVIPPSVVVHRITGDGPKKDLIAPLWSANKKLVLNEINRRIKQQQTVQHQ